MAKIFISYRRSDASADAGRLRARLVQAFGDDVVFQDVNSIDVGDRFAEVIDSALSRCEVFLAIIGPTWLTCTNADGSRRLDHPDDWVRVETAKALAHKRVTVFPVLVRTRTDLKESQLPPDLKELAGLLHFIIDEDKWDYVVDLLIQKIARRLSFWARWKRRIVFGTVVAATVAIVGGMALQMLHDVPAVTGMTLEEARALLAQRRLAVGDVIAEESDQKRGSVIGQTPAPGMRWGSTGVRLTVAESPADVRRWAAVRDTGEEGTAAAVAMAQAMEVALAFQGRPIQLSARYLYEKAKQHDETKGEGTYLSAVTYAAERFGVPPADAWPYNRRTPPPAMSWERLDKLASEFRAKPIRVSTIEGVADQLRAGRAVLARVTVMDKAWDYDRTKTDGVIRTIPGDREFGSTAIVIVSVDPKDKSLRFSNTWGREWGEKGFGRMTAEAAKKMLVLDEMWAIEVPPPVPSR